MKHRILQICVAPSRDTGVMCDPTLRHGARVT